MTDQPTKPPSIAEKIKNIAATHPVRRVLPWAMVAGFFILAGGVSFLMWLGSKDLPQAEINTHFLLPGHVVEKQRLEDPLGWGSELLIDKAKDKPAKIRFMLRDPNRKPVKDAAISVTFFRPKKDLPSVSLPLQMDEPGVYRGEASLPQGLWEAHIAVRVGDYAYQVGQRVTLP